MAATSGLVGYWRLDDTSGSTACDELGQDPGTYQGGVTLGQSGAIAGDSDTAVAFNGSSGDVSVPSSSTISTADTFSVETWVKRGSTGGSSNQVIASKGSGWSLAFNTSNDLILQSNGRTITTSTKAVTDTSGWHYIAATKSGSSVHLYLDGADVTGSVSNRTVSSNSTALQLGASGSSGWLKGTLDEVGLYNAAISSSQVSNHYLLALASCPATSSSYATTVSAASGLVGYWRLGEKSGTTACDSAGQNPGSYQGTVTLGQSGAITGDSDTAALFDGSSGSVSVAALSSLNTADTFSIEAWVKRGSTGGSSNQVIASKQGSAWTLAFNTSNDLILQSNGTTITTSTAAVSDTTSWHYVAATKSGSTVHLYLDGQDVTGSVSNVTMSNSTSPLAIAQSGASSSYLKGTLDEVALYNVALSGSQVQNHYALARPPVDTSLPTVSGTTTDGQTLSASPGSWSGGTPTYSYQWESCNSSGGSCQNISGATGSTYTLGHGDVGTTLRVAVTATNAGGSATATSSQTAVIAAAAPTNTGLPTIAGTTTDGQTLTASNGSWGGTPASSYSYQWQSCDTSGNNCQNIGGATNSTYMLAHNDVGTTIRVTVTATNSAGSAQATSNQSAVIAAAPPTNTTLPTISGTTTDGQTLTASNGTWSGTPASSYTYQWQSCDQNGNNCANVQGATGQTYVLAAGDVGTTLRVVVTATNSAGSAAAASTQTAVVSAAPPVNTQPPTITGSLAVDAVLTGSQGSWTGTSPSYSYQWQSCDSSGNNCANVQNATGATYDVGQGDVGNTLRVAVTATNTAGSARAVSAATAVVPAPVDCGGGVEPCQKYEMTVAGDGPVADFRFQDPAGSSTLLDSVGSFSATNNGISLGQSGAFAGSSSGSFNGSSSYASLPSSPLTGANAFTAEGWVYWKGGNAWQPIFSFGAGTNAYVFLSPSNGGGVTAEFKGPSTGSYDVSGSSLSQNAWHYLALTEDTSGTVTLYLDGQSAGQKTGIPVSPASLGTTTQNWLGRPQNSNNPYFNGGMQDVAFYTKALTAAQIEAHYAASETPLANTAPPSISGTPEYGQTLTAAPGSWSGSNPSYSYQWQSCDASGNNCANVQGATGQSYTIGAGDVGNSLRVVVTASNALGSAQATSTQTGVVVAYPPQNTAPPSISGQTQDGQTLTATPGSWSGSSPSYAYQWQSCDSSGNNCANLQGATNATYALGSGDVGTTLRVVVTASNPAGSAQATSQQTAVVQEVAPVNETPPSISGSPSDGQTLTIDPGQWNVSGPQYSYQWQSCDPYGNDCINIPGAVGSTYIVNDSDAGSTVRGLVTASNSAGRSTATAQQTQPVTVQDGSTGGSNQCFEDAVQDWPGYQYAAYHAAGQGPTTTECNIDILWRADMPAGWLWLYYSSSGYDPTAAATVPPDWNPSSPNCADPPNTGTYDFWRISPSSTGNPQLSDLVCGAFGNAAGRWNPARPHTPHCQAKDPVDCATGNFTEDYTDLAMKGVGGGLSLTRSYNSQDAAQASAPGPFGYGWSAAFREHLDLGSPYNGSGPPSMVTVHHANGSTATFTWNGSGYQAEPGVESTLTHNSDGSFTYTLPDRTSYDFNSSGVLQSQADHDGNTTTLSYNGQGQLATVSAPSGRTITFTYNSDGTVATATDAAGHEVSYSYTNQNLTSVTDVGGGTTQFGYDGSHQITTVIDPRGNTVTTNVYDSNNRVTKQTDALGRATTWSYNDNTTRITDPAGNVTDEVFAGGVPVSITSGVGTSQESAKRITYNSNSEPLWVVDGDRHVTKYGYDSNGNETSATDPLGHTTQYTYDGQRDVTSVATPAGHTTNFGYGSSGDLTSIKRTLTETGDTPTTTLMYDATGDLTKVTDPLNRSWTYGYDAQGDRTSATSPLGHETTTSYDADGYPTSQTSARGNEAGADPAAYTTQIARNAYELPMTVTDPKGGKTIYGYDADQNLTDYTDADSRHTNIAYDAANQATQVTRGDGSVLKTGYDPNGNIASQSDGLQHTTSYTYDPLGRLSSVTDPLNRTETLAYDGAGNRTSLTDQLGQTTSYAYDAANELTSIAYSSGNPGNVTIAYNPDGQRTSMTDTSGTTNYTYDSLDRLTSQTSGAGQKTGYGYDLADELTSIAYPAALTALNVGGGGSQQQITEGTVTRGYDSDGNLASVSDWLSHTTSFGYDADENLTSVSRPNGTSASYTVDANSDTTGIQDVGGQTSYGRSAAGLLSSLTPPAGTQQNYGYDGAARLTSANGATYQYDAGDNLTQTLNRQGQTVNQSFDNANELATVAQAGTTIDTLGYDAKGNRTTDSGQGTTTTYAYDQANELIGYNGPDRSNSGQTASDQYVYNAAGLRQTKTYNGQLTNEAYDEAQGLPLIIEDGPTAYITGPGGLPIEQVAQDGTARYYSRDQLGSTTALTDQSGSTVGTFSYDVYGNRSSAGSALTPFGFAGQYTDPETGLQYLRARYYDPTTGQFMSRDPLGMLTREPYAYAGNQPTNATDPTGLFSFSDFVNFVAGAGDTGTFGLTSDIRQLIGDDNVDYCSSAYSAGGWAGLGALLLLPGGDILDLADGSRLGDQLSAWWDRLINEERGGSIGGNGDIGEHPDPEISFGHGERHLTGTGISPGAVESAIDQSIRNTIQDETPGVWFRGRVSVGGKTIEYRAYVTKSGRIHVGTYYPVDG